MWSQSWVVTAPDEAAARTLIREALATWAPQNAGQPELGSWHFFRGPDELALADTVATDLAHIRQTVAQGNRQELSRRLQALSHRAIGIPPRPGYVVLDDDGPRSPRPLDCRSQKALRWVQEVLWPGTPPPDPFLASSSNT